MHAFNILTQWEVLKCLKKSAKFDLRLRYICKSKQKFVKIVFFILITFIIRPLVQFSFLSLFIRFLIEMTSPKIATPLLAK